MKIYNQKTHPELANIKLGNIKLAYSKHAVKRCIEKEILKQATIDICLGSVIELEEDDQGRPTKVVVRAGYNSTSDIVMALVPESRKLLQQGKLLVTTLWLNDKKDNHATLNTERLACQ